MDILPYCCQGGPPRNTPNFLGLVDFDGRGGPDRVSSTSPVRFEDDDVLPSVPRQPVCKTPGEDRSEGDQTYEGNGRPSWSLPGIRSLSFPSSVPLSQDENNRKVFSV